VDNQSEDRPWPGQPDRGELFEQLVESATDFAIFTIDADGLITSWNIGSERVIGYSESEILSTTADVIFTQEDRAAGAPELERAKALREGRADDERWHLRKDGSVFWGSGLLMPLRRGGGFLKIMRDRTEQHLAQARLAVSEERFRILATSIPQLVFRTRPSGARSWGSPQWEVYAGLSDADSREFGWLEAVHPDDRAATIEGWTHARRSRVYSVEHRIRRHADGAYRWHQTRALPAAIESGGREEEWVGTSTDIHELRGLQGRQQVLLAELQHRTRNLLALVQAIARRTLRGAGSFPEFIAVFENRLAALSRVQNLIASTRDDAIPLPAVIETELQAHIEGAQERISVAGPDIEIPTNAAQTLALAIYELATNAVKYGAIGQPQARLDVAWRVERQQKPVRVVLEWRESGVSMPDTTARRRGYGRELIERALPYQLGAETRIDFGATGVHCTIAVPMKGDSQREGGHE
jgi:PAS domain S-box-containing protein